MPYLKVLILVLIALVAISSAVNSTTVTVPTDFSVLQDAANAISPGDTILILPGTYTGADFSTNNVTVLGVGDIDLIILSSGPDSSTVKIRGDSITIQSLTITDALCNGIYIGGNYAVIKNNIITSNGSPNGRGIYVGDTVTHVEIIDNEIRNHSYYHEYGIQGGGIYCAAEYFVIQGNLIKNNQVGDSGNSLGGGLYCKGGGIISGNVIDNNEAYIGATGISSFAFGGGVYLDNSESPISIEFSNNTVISNTCSSYALSEGTARGGGIYCVDGGAIHVDRNIIYNNHSESTDKGGDSRSDVDCGGIYADGPLESFYANLVYANWPDGLPYYYCGYINWETDYYLNEDPKICSVSDEYYDIKCTSPCNPLNNSLGLLIGAKEVGCYECGDFNGDCAINILDITATIAYLYQGGTAPEPWECVGDVNGLDPPTINILDITYMIAYLYQQGALPDDNCCNPVW